VGLNKCSPGGIVRLTKVVAGVLVLEPTVRTAFLRSAGCKREVNKREIMGKLPHEIKGEIRNEIKRI